MSVVRIRRNEVVQGRRELYIFVYLYEYTCWYLIKRLSQRKRVLSGLDNVFVGEYLP